MVNSIKSEMTKAIKKENFLKIKEFFKNPLKLL